MDGIQLTLFGKMFPEHSAPTKERISGEFSKKSQRPKFQYLNLENGEGADWSEYQTVKSLGELSMPNIGESPSAENASTLSAILEQNAPRKYYLSAKACSGILCRAERRGKKLPPLLEAVLRKQAEEVESPPELSNVFEMTHADEVIRKTDEDVCPTLQARMGTGGNQIPLIVDAYAIGNGQADNSGLHDLVGALNCMHDQQAVMYAIDRAAFNQGENAKYDFEINDKGVASTLVSRVPSAVCMLNNQGGSSISAEDDAKVSPTIRAEMHGNIPAVCGTVPLDNVASTLRAGAGAPKREQDVLGRLCLQRIVDTVWRWIVRRLTPRECERLQGFPDD